MITAFAPGRVNLIGEYTDLADGPVLPMAIDLGTTVTGTAGGEEVALTSADDPTAVSVGLSVTEPTAVEPAWGRYVAGVVAELAPHRGFTGHVTTTLPVGAGLSSSAALEVAVALALGFEGDVHHLAALARRAEHRASGVPCGIMDQLASAAGVAGHALLIDCHSGLVDPVPLPDDVEVRVVHSGQPRALTGSAYADRKAAVDAAQAELGPLRLVEDPGVVERLADPVLRRRARHVVSETGRVHAMADALRRGDLTAAGTLLGAGHASLRDDLEVSTPVLDALVGRLAATPGVHGVRLTGAGFGGCVVALTRPGALDVGWRVTASAGARVVDGPGRPGRRIGPAGR